MESTIVIQILKTARDEFLTTARATPADKANWRPLEIGRSVADLATANRIAARNYERILVSRGEDIPTPEEFWSQVTVQAQDTVENETAAIEASTDRLFAVLAGYTETDWSRVIHVRTPRALRSQPALTWALSFNRAFYTRIGQINYIQRLYGDDEMHR